jgi:hypothetical protein
MDEYSIGREMKRMIQDELSSSPVSYDMINDLQVQVRNLRLTLDNQNLHIFQLEEKIEKNRKLALGFDDIACEVMDTLIENIPESMEKEAELADLARLKEESNYLPF